jgi:hypothetical protein
VSLGLFSGYFQVILLIVSASCGLMLCGISFGWTAQVGVQLRDPLHPDYGFGVSDEIYSWIGSTLNIGRSPLAYFP